MKLRHSRAEAPTEDWHFWQVSVSFHRKCFENAQRRVVQKSLQIYIPDAEHDETAARLAGSADKRL